MYQFGIPYTKENALAVKSIFKEYLKVASTAALSDSVFSSFSQAFAMLAAREFGIEVPLNEASKSMEELLKDYNYG